MNTKESVQEILQIDSPTLIVDKTKCMSNFEAMRKKAEKNNVSFRPHFKTHQSLEIGGWFKETGTSGISVSSLDMANYFAAGGFDDITVCVPVNILEMDKINVLAQKISLNCIVDSKRAMSYLMENLKGTIGLFIEVDCGYRRTGVPSENHDMIREILKIAGSCTKTVFRGFLTHAGHSYHTESTAQIREIHCDTLTKMGALKKAFDSDHPDLIISIGDTPCCSVIDNFEGMDEARPGNFVFYDLTQAQLGSCSPDQIAVAMACPVIGIYPERGEVVIHGGGVHLGKEALVNKDGKISYGQIVDLAVTGWNGPIPDVNVKSLSQEHGIVAGPIDFISRVKIGDLLGVLPVHSCITADTARSYMTLDGKRLDHMKGSSLQ